MELKGKMSNRKNLLIALAILIVSFLAIFGRLLLTSKETDDNTDARETMDHENIVRIKFGVPLIESGWIEHRRNENSSYWANRIRGVSDYKPFHLSKTINISQGTTVSEEDDFPDWRGSYFRALIKLPVKSEMGMEEIIRDLKKYTATHICKAIESNPQESRREWMLGLFRSYGAKTGKHHKYKFWQGEFHPIELNTNKMMDDRLQYIHYNPVEAGIVYEPESYLYSSAVDYGTKRKGFLEIEYI